MAVNMQMTVEGGSELLEKLRQLTGGPNRAVERGILEEAAMVIVNAAKSNAARYHRTGRLEEKITISRRVIRQNGASIRMGVPRFQGVGYGTPLEWGHVNRNGTFTRPRPFMQNAYEENKAEAYGIIREGLREEIIKRGGEA